VCNVCFKVILVCYSGESIRSIYCNIVREEHVYMRVMWWRNIMRYYQRVENKMLRGENKWWNMIVGGKYNNG